jgi:cell division protein FtsQ
MDTFRVTGVRVEGARFFTPEDALRTLGIPPSASVWDDLDAWERRLRDHPLVEDVHIHRRLPGTLILDVTEPTPVALVPSPTLEPVDGSGRILPIDPSLNRLDLPVISLEGSRETETPSAAERRLLAGEVARLARLDPELLARLSQMTLRPRGDLRAQIWRRDLRQEVWDLPVNLLFYPELSLRRIQEGLRVLDDAFARFDGAGISDLDLRYEDQVVVRMNRSEEG